MKSKEKGGAGGGGGGAVGGGKPSAFVLIFVDSSGISGFSVHEAAVRCMKASSPPESPTARIAKNVPFSL